VDAPFMNRLGEVLVEQQLMLLWLQIIAMLERGCQTPVEIT